MASDSKVTLNDAILAMEAAYQRLTDATDSARLERANFAAKSEAVQEEITASWVSHTGRIEAEKNEIEAALAKVTSENAFLKDDNLRLSNQLQTLQKEFVELQRSTGDVLGTLDRSVRQLDMILEH